jgi:hypothetical protein
MDGQYKVYLAGAITGCSFNECVDWREEFISKLPPQIHGMSPLRGKSYLEEEEDIANDSSQMNLVHEVQRILSSERGLTTRDYNDVRTANLVVANFLGAAKVSIGTVMEVAWARAFQIPTILVIEPSGNLHEHAMIRDSVGFRVATLEEAVWLTKVILLPAPHRSSAMIDVNGRKVKARKRMSYHDVCALAYPEHPNYAYSVTYRRAEGQKSEGCLVPGQYIDVKDGTSISVADTSNA